MLKEWLSAGTDIECGCPYEEWAIDGIHTTIHLEPDGSAHAEFQTDEWDDEAVFECSDFESARAAASDWIAGLPA